MRSGVLSLTFTRCSWVGCSSKIHHQRWNNKTHQHQIHQHQAFGCLFFLELFFFLFADPPLLCLFFRNRLGPVLHGFFHLAAFQHLNYKAPESRRRVSPLDWLKGFSKTCTELLWARHNMYLSKWCTVSHDTSEFSIQVTDCSSNICSAKSNIPSSSSRQP